MERSQQTYLKAQNNESQTIQEIANNSSQYDRSENSIWIQTDANQVVSSKTQTPMPAEKRNITMQTQQDVESKGTAVNFKPKTSEIKIQTFQETQSTGLMVDIKPKTCEIKVQTSQEVKSMGLMTDLKPNSIEAMIQAC